MKKLSVGVLAHVDAGKTTFIEALLYEAGVIRMPGRVDSKDSYLDTEAQERARGITIHLKNARISFEEKNLELILIDTPGHIDFAPEMERCLCVLDVAILVVGANDGVSPHTKTLFKLLSEYNIPTYIFVNKNDMPGVDKSQILTTFRNKLDENVIDFSTGTEDAFETIATVDENLLDEWLETGTISALNVFKCIADRQIFPTFFGSALKFEGIDYFLNTFVSHLSFAKCAGEKTDAFGGFVYKIGVDKDGKRLTFVKITSGSLKVKDIINEEKVNEIRLYSGEKYRCVNEVYAGEICALVSVKNLKIFDALGTNHTGIKTYFNPVFCYAVKHSEQLDTKVVYSKLHTLSDEEPTLKVSFNADAGEILVYLMGEVQAEILQNTISNRFGFKVEFANGRILYKETIDAAYEGVGHYEPLKHYAEAHIMLEPSERGAGMSLEANISEDVLARNWQRLIYTHMAEKEHKGVLLGAPITDVNMRLVSGKAHLKHTEGGDFRQATYRAIRQGLMELKALGKCRVLEPYYEYTLVVPSDCLGRAMNDINRMSGTFEIAENDGVGNIAVLVGKAPVSTMSGYFNEVLAYSKGAGRLMLNVSSYEICHNEEELIAMSDYNPDADIDNTAASVFCSHGAGYTVSWDEVPKCMHLQYEKTDG